MPQSVTPRRLYGVGRLSDCFHDINVASAAAKISGDGILDLFVAWITIVFEKLRHRHEKSRGAETTLQGMVLVKRLLHWSKRAFAGQALHRNDFGTVRLCGEQQAASRGLAVETDRAGPANTVRTGHVRSSETELMPQEVGEQHAAFDRPLIRLPVDDDADLALPHVHSTTPSGKSF
jgi:hypothetical protein